MRGQVGYWGCEQGGLVVGFSHEMMTWLKHQGSDRKVSVLVADRRVEVVPDLGGASVSPTGDRSGSPFRYRSSGFPPSLVVDGLLPVFGLLDTHFEDMGSFMRAELPTADHELPWPLLRDCCSTYDASALAVEALQVRMNSLVASGLSSFPLENRMPMQLRRLLPEGAWAEALRTARTLSGAL